MALLATNTIGQGDTREVGLDQLLDSGWSIPRAISSRPWPGGANLEVAHLWLQRNAWTGPVNLDDLDVHGITGSLEPRSRVGGRAHRLTANGDQSFVGSYVLGMGFVLSPEEAKALIHRDPHNGEVVMPYLNGEDLNSRPDQSPARWVINFRDWPLERAREYGGPFAIVERLVKAERQRNNDLRQRETWWRFKRHTLELYDAIRDIDRALVIARVSKTVQPVFVPTGIVVSDQVVVFAYDDDTHFGLLSSGFHWWWAAREPRRCATTSVTPPPTASRPSPSPTSHPRSATPAGRWTRIAARSCSTAGRD